MGGLIGVATSDKNGLCKKENAPYYYPKNDNTFARALIYTTGGGQIFVGVLTCFSTNGKSFTILLNAGVWNETKVYAKIINGDKFSNLELLYRNEDNYNISIYIKYTGFIRIDMLSFSYIGSSIQSIDSIPEDATSLSF